MNLKKMQKNGSATINRKKIDTIEGYAFIAPLLVCFFTFTVLPLILAFYYSFTNYRLLGKVKWIGLENYIDLFTDPVRMQSFANTFKFLIILVSIHVILGLFLAYLVYSVKNFKNFFRSAIYFPTVVTTASVAIAWGYIFGTDLGVINYYVRLLGGENIRWLTDETIVYFTISLFSFWKFIGTTFLYYFIALQNVPKVFYEAAKIDGSGSVRTFFNITVPLISPTIFFVLITTVIGVFQIFDEPFFLTKGGPGNATKTIALEIYETAFQQMKVGIGSSISFVLFICIMIITLVQFYVQKKWVVYDYE